jgi:hypothetical protein
MKSVFLAAAFAAVSVVACASPSSEEALGESTENLGQSVDVPNPSGAYFARITANGTGCPAGTWDASISPDGKAFTVTFSKYESIVEPGQLFSIKDCNLAIDLRTPEGFSFSVSSFHYQGYALLDQAGMSAKQTAKYYFQGNPVPAKENRSELKGSYDDSYVFSDQIGIADLVWSPCGAQRTLNAATRLVLQNNPAKTGTGYLNTASADGEIETVFRFGLSWKRCGEEPPPPPPPPAGCGELPSGGILARNTVLKSCDGRNEFWHQDDGHIVLYHDGQPLWYTKVLPNDAKDLIMQADGNLVQYTESGTPTWWSNTATSPGAHLVVQNDCNAVIYNTAGRAVWNTRTTGCRRVSF